MRFPPCLLDCTTLGPFMTRSRHLKGHHHSLAWPACSSSCFPVTLPDMVRRTFIMCRPGHYSPSSRDSRKPTLGLFISVLHFSLLGLVLRCPPQSVSSSRGRAVTALNLFKTTFTPTFYRPCDLPHLRDNKNNGLIVTE